ncbi:hypothetical protein [uncultured Thiodictyon sp.]|uniref:hypothetical protein n=1 Tax=uncultured Thiodictyon sp. TaxID=1846217 RepID=UPI0025CCF299|nr:hypothetical protein [uncultured Thiodictyon sp.]
MAEPRRSKRPIQDSRFSRPVFEETITIHSSHAQRILDRGYYRVAAALYAIDVVLRIIGDHDEMDAVEGLVNGHIQTFATAMDDENKRLMILRDQSGSTRTVKYTRPITLRIQISSPQMAQYTLLIQELDRLMMAIDSLWMNAVLTSKQKAMAGYDWRVALLRIGREIMTLERRARDAAARYGKADEVAAATAETDVVVEHDADPTPSPQSLS